MASERAWKRINAVWDPDDGDGTVRGPEALRLESVARPRRVVELGPANGDGPGAGAAFSLRRAYPAGPMPDPGAAPFVLLVRVYAPDADRAEFRRWLDDEHAMRQLTIPGVRWYVGYEEDGARHSFLNLWGIDEPSVVEGERWAKVRDTEWWRRVAHVPANADRAVFQVVRR